MGGVQLIFMGDLFTRLLVQISARFKHPDDDHRSQYGLQEECTNLIEESDKNKRALQGED